MCHLFLTQCYLKFLYYNCTHTNTHTTPKHISGQGGAHYTYPARNDGKGTNDHDAATHQNDPSPERPKGVEELPHSDTRIGLSSLDSVKLVLGTM